MDSQLLYYLIACNRDAERIIRSGALNLPINTAISSAGMQYLPDISMENAARSNSSNENLSTRGLQLEALGKGRLDEEPRAHFQFETVIHPRRPVFRIPRYDTPQLKGVLRTSEVVIILGWWLPSNRS